MNDLINHNNNVLVIDTSTLESEKMLLTAFVSVLFNDEEYIVKFINNNEKDEYLLTDVVVESIAVLAKKLNMSNDDVVKLMKSKFLDIVNSTPISYLE